MSTSESNEQRETSLENALRVIFRDLLKSVHTMLPGIIESFDATTQRAKVALATSQMCRDGQILNHPPLINVPVQFPRWGSFTISFPVNPGNQCAVFFSERSLDKYLRFGKVSDVPDDTRFFDLSDAFAVPGLSSDEKIVPDYDSNNLVLKHDSGTCEMKFLPVGDVQLKSGDLQTNFCSEGKISINNPAGELISIIDGLFQLIEEEEVVGWNPTPKAAYIALKNKLETFVK